MKNLEKITSQKVLVVGDMMLDKYILGSVERISPEAPVPVLKQKKVERKLGGAGNVVLNITTLGAKVRAVGRIGNDAEGCYFREILQKNGVDDTYIFAEGNTVVKTRVTAGTQQFLRIDEETVQAPSQAIMNTLLSQMEKLFKDITIVILSDYAKGFLSVQLCQTLITEAQKRKIPVLVDPKGKDISKYKGATAVTPNNKEFLDFVGLPTMPSEEEIHTLALELCRDNSIYTLIITRSEKGISTVESSTGAKTDFPAEKKEVIDVTGAGDTVVALLALTLGVGFPLHVCAKLANIAASVVISKFGVAQITLNDLQIALKGVAKSGEKQQILDQIAKLKKSGKTIVFTNGCFDIMHAGHISSFHQAKHFGDVLVVGLNSDQSIKRIKGESRPVVCLNDRITMLCELECVDFVIPFEEDTPQKLIEEVCPDVLVKGKDWEGKPVAGAEFVTVHGGKVVFIELEQGLSTSAIIGKIKDSLA